MTEPIPASDPACDPGADPSFPPICASPSTPRRLVAIIGRPNVGKSAIFNRLAGRRLAIVHSESGVTRDRLMCEATWGDERFDLVDTGGVCNVDNAVSADTIAAGIRQQVDAALADAAVALLVVDVEVGVHPMDLEVAGILRRHGMCTFVAVNKADDAGRDLKAAEFSELGFPVHPVSALHRRGFDPLMAAVLERLPQTENISVANPLKVAIIGRPNVGKSSFVNRLLQSDRVIVSPVAGTTRDCVDIPFTVGTGAQARHYLLIDTPGMRPSGRIDSAVERYGRMRAEESIERADVVVLVMDTFAGPTSFDKRIASRVAAAGRGCVLLVNKWDLAEGQTTQTQYGPAVNRVMPFVAHCPIVFVSSQTGYNIRNSVDAIDHVAGQIRASLPTGVLNRTITEACERTAPPAIKGHRLRIYYATQVGQAPIRIRVFVNYPEFLLAPYETYLVRALRSKFGLEGAPVVMEFRARSRPPNPFAPTPKIRTGRHRGRNSERPQNRGTDGIGSQSKGQGKGQGRSQGKSQGREGGPGERGRQRVDGSSGRNGGEDGPRSPRPGRGSRENPHGGGRRRPRSRRGGRR